jgi:hypothetical protein
MIWQKQFSEICFEPVKKSQIHPADINPPEKEVFERKIDWQPSQVTGCLLNVLMLFSKSEYYSLILLS